MKLNPQVKGAILVFLGAMSYGILATMVKYANIGGTHTSVLTFMQFVVGVVFLLIYANASSKAKNNTTIRPKSKIKLFLFGTTFGMTSLFYYISIQYIPVSLGIILLMQAIWMSVLLEAIVDKKRPTWLKVIGTITILFGTLLATNVFFEPANLDIKGLIYGLLAAISFTISMYASGNIETTINSRKKSLFMILGGFIFVCIYWNTDILHYFEWKDALIWGIPLGVFGTIIPPLLFTKGMLLTGSGLGAIIAAVEIPVSILSAFVFLHETISGYQWLGVIIILGSVVLVNLPKKGY